MLLTIEIKVVYDDDTVRNPAEVKDHVKRRLTQAIGKGLLTDYNESVDILKAEFTIVTGK